MDQVTLYPEGSSLSLEVSQFIIKNIKHNLSVSLHYEVNLDLISADGDKGWGSAWNFSLSL